MKELLKNIAASAIILLFFLPIVMCQVSAKFSFWWWAGFIELSIIVLFACTVLIRLIKEELFP